MLDGRSSGGRYGLSVHICVGFGDIGFDGNWTLEITVEHPLRLYPGDEIAQVSYFVPYGDTYYLYHGRYQNQNEAVPSRGYQKKTKFNLHDALEMKEIVSKSYDLMNCNGNIERFVKYYADTEIDWDMSPRDGESYFTITREFENATGPLFDYVGNVQMIFKDGKTIGYRFTFDSFGLKGDGIYARF